MTTCTARGQVQANLDQFVNDMTAHFRECKGANLAAGAHQEHQEGRHSTQDLNRLQFHSGPHATLHPALRAERAGNL